MFYETYKVLEEKVDVYGDAAIYSAKLIERSQGESKAGKTPRTTLFTHFLVKQDGEWKVARAHVAHPPVK
jgi:ketosteroid isomerase-like protein